MVELKQVSFGSESWASVWSIDDAWFEGFGAVNSGSIEEEIKLTACNSNYDQLLAAIDERTTKSEVYGEVKLKTEIEYLRVLAQLCKENNLRLRLCNFEYFETNYDEEINWGKTAVLLDVNYANFQRSDKKSSSGELFTANDYGVFLLAKMLDGERSRAEIFFVTSFGGTVEKVLVDHRKTEKWWLLRTIPVISKASMEITEGISLQDELSYFVKHFKQGIERDPIKEFSQALIYAQSENLSHPEPADMSLMIPSWFPLRDAFLKDVVDGSDSFKALYHVEGGASRKGKRNLLTFIFKRHLEYSGVKLSTREANFRLPVNPGMLFILCLLDLHRTLGVNDESLQLEIEQNGNRGLARMEIPLRSDESTKFESAYYCRDKRRGAAVSALRRLLACKLDVVQGSLGKRNPVSQTLATEWGVEEYVSEDLYPLLMQLAITNRSIVLTWEFETSPQPSKLAGIQK